MVATAVGGLSMRPCRCACALAQWEAIRGAHKRACCCCCCCHAVHVPMDRRTVESLKSRWNRDTGSLVDRCFMRALAKPMFPGGGSVQQFVIRGPPPHRDARRRKLGLRPGQVGPERPVVARGDGRRSTSPGRRRTSARTWRGDGRSRRERDEESETKPKPGDDPVRRGPRGCRSRRRLGRPSARHCRSGLKQTIPTRLDAS